ncbi:hypothetical protein HQ531_02500 [bacterium]|nr:hypothetical protein [bacterium]
MLEKEYKYYESNKEDLVAKYSGQFIVIYGDKIVGAYTSREDALTQSIKKYKIGAFLIQEVASSSDDDVMMFHSQVAFV